jgi:hypothetical protein
VLDIYVADPNPLTVLCNWVDEIYDADPRPRVVEKSGEKLDTKMAPNPSIEDMSCCDET